jgi:hypothetical protein
MKQIPSDKYTLAWFKLAEFVSKGERERALAIYKLLAHSLEDKAFVHQLEGDLLLSFNDEGAFERYAQAAELYSEQGHAAKTCAVYEHMIALEPTAENRVTALLEIAKKIIQEPRAVEVTQHFLRWLMNKKEFSRVSLILKQLEPLTLAFAPTHQELVQAWLKSENPPQESVLEHVKKTIDYYFSVKQPKSLQTFLMTLKMMHALVYQEACCYMQDANLKV